MITGKKTGNKAVSSLDPPAENPRVADLLASK
jgi:hypothetical protein